MTVFGHFLIIFIKLFNKNKYKIIVKYNIFIYNKINN